MLKKQSEIIVAIIYHLSSVCLSNLSTRENIDTYIQTDTHIHTTVKNGLKDYISYKWLSLVDGGKDWELR